MANDKKYYWLKLMNDFFTQPRIKKLRRIAGGDTYTIIYLKLQLLSLKNDGVLIFEGIEDDVIQELALTIDEKEDDVLITFQYLLKQGLIEQLDKENYLMTETQYLIGSETAGAARVRKHRENKKALHCNPLVTLCNTEIEIEKDKEIDKEKEKEIEKSKKEDSTSEPQDPPILSLILNTKEEYPIYKIDIEAWHDLYPAVDVIGELRKMKGWLMANPSKRKTKKGILRFINSWLAKEQDRPHYNKPSNPIDPFENYSHADPEPAAEISETEYKTLMDDINEMLKK